MRISDKRHEEAQIAERRFHDNDIKHHGLDKVLSNYSESYAHNQEGKSIIEIGPAHIPALYFCENYSQSLIIEPMPSDTLRELINYLPIYISTSPAEETEIEGKADEVWMFNLLQHVLDPNELIENAKKWANTIRFFEPVDQPISDCHPHAPTQEDFKRWFGDSAKLYKENPNAVNFHTAKCMHGTWIGDI